MKFFIAIPTYNGGQIWQQTVNSIKKYAPRNTFVQIIDSGSSDNTVELARNADFDVINITSNEFNHGGTRNQLVYENSKEFDVVIFLTQDAIPQANFVENIITAFNDPLVACAYGRQYPHSDASYIARHARKFNYPSNSHISTRASAEVMGLKSVFMSNSFSAYRISTFKELGGFPKNTILCEDMFFAAKALSAGYKSAYVANATVAHSHNYSVMDEFKRYFDIGVFHENQSWIKKTFGGAGNEGKKFIFSEFIFLLKKRPYLIPKALLANVCKLIGYRLGGMYKKLPISIILKVSMHKRYWKS